MYLIFLRFYLYTTVRRLKNIKDMTVKELIETLQKLPQEYEVTSESGDAYGSGYLAWVDDVEVKDKDKIVILKEY